MHRTPIVFVKLACGHVPLAVSVNGGLAYRQWDNSGGQYGFPINHWLMSGKNELRLTLPPRAEIAAAAEVLAQVQWRPNGTPPEQNRPLASLAFTALGLAAGTPCTGSSPAGSFDSERDMKPDDDFGDVVVGEPVEETQADGGLMIKRAITVKLPFPAWDFFSADELDPRSETLKKELVAQYQTIAAEIAAAKFDQVIDRCRKRSEEYDAAYFKSAGETAADLRDTITKVVAQKRTPIPVKRWKDRLVLHPGRKLVEVRDVDELNENLIGWQVTPQTRLSLAMTFCRRDGVWLVAR